MNEWMSEWVSEWMNEWLIEWMNEWGAGNAKKWLHCLMKHPCRHHSRILLWTPAPLLTDNQIKKGNAAVTRTQDKTTLPALFSLCAAVPYTHLHRIVGPQLQGPVQSHPVPSSPAWSQISNNHPWSTILCHRLYQIAGTSVVRSGEGCAYTVGRIM